MAQLRKEITAERDEYERILCEEIVPSTPVYLTIPERLPPMCVLFETYAPVNGESMRLPPDVMEGVIPMVGRRRSRVFYRQMTISDINEKYSTLWNDMEKKFSLPDRMSDDALASILRQHNWFVLQDPHCFIFCGAVHFYDDAGNEQSFMFSRNSESDDITINMDRSAEPLVLPIVERAMRDFGRWSKRSQQG